MGICWQSASDANASGQLAAAGTVESGMRITSAV